MLFLSLMNVEGDYMIEKYNKNTRRTLFEKETLYSDDGQITLPALS